jgi:hypothetical protein
VAAQHPEEERLLGLEVVEDPRVADADALRDRGDRGAAVARGGEEGGGRLEDLVPAVD